MNKRVLIISPFFPPSNAADMQRIRMSLPYFKDFGWEAEVMTVDPKYSEIPKDDLLLQSILKDAKIHIIAAFNKSWTSKLGLGSIALRSLWSYRQKVNRLLKKRQFDLIYFSTTQFPVCILGSYWKKKFNVPYVIDMQDPWHSDYYLDKPRAQQPPKYWLSYRLNKYLEPIAMKRADGLISVSEDYINDLKNRYEQLKDVPAATITFGAFEADMQIAEANRHLFEPLLLPGFTNIVYIGRGGADMHKAITVLFKALSKGLGENETLFDRIRIYFIGTSYAPQGKGSPTILPLAKQFGLENSVFETTDRISYYHTLTTLLQADALFIPGSDDPKYTASKIYPYLLTRKPLLAIFNSESSAIGILKECGAKHVYSFDRADKAELEAYDFLEDVATNQHRLETYDQENLRKYSAENMTRRQCSLFDEVTNKTI